MLDQHMYTTVRAKSAAWWTKLKPNNTELEAALATVYTEQRLAAPTLIWCESPMQLSIMPFMLTTLSICPPSSRAMLVNSLSEARCRHAMTTLTAQLCEKQKKPIEGLVFPNIVNATNVHEQLLLNNTLVLRSLLNEISKTDKSTAAAYRDAVNLTSTQRTLERSQRILAGGVQALTPHTQFKSFRAEPTQLALSPRILHSFELEQFSLFRQTLEEIDWLLDGGLGDFEMHVGACTFSNTISWAQISFDALFRLSCLAEVLGKQRFENSTDFNQVKPHLLIRSSALAYIFSSTCVFASHSPTLARFDNIQRLHSDIGPSIEFADGFSLNSWHGITIPDELAKNPTLLTIERIERENNAEIRSAMMERYGFEKFIQDSGAKLISDDEHFGKLYQKFMAGTPFCFVKVKNSSPEPDGSYKDYILQVPPDVRTAKEAVAWTFGMTERDYSPVVET